MWKVAVRFLKNWTLPISMLAGILGFVLVDALPLSGAMRHTIVRTAEVVQPLLIFVMLFLACCKIELPQMRLHLWQGVLLAVQSLGFGLLAWGTVCAQGHEWAIVAESAMLCAIMPTATAAAVVANKLGGDMTGVVAYTMLSNLLAAIALPLFVPLLQHQGEMNFLPAFWRILGHIFPMLILPFLLAVTLRRACPRWVVRLTKVRDLPFYLWCVCLPISIALAMKTLLHSHISLLIAGSIALASLAVCLLSFAIGRRIGRRYETAVAGAQSMGQKNTAFGIWVAYTFLTPVTSIAGGFYAIWHNIYNAYQLAQQRKHT